MTTPRTLAKEGEDAAKPLQILVVEGDVVTVHDLPAEGSLLVGRGAEADVPLADPSTSARHARLHVEKGAILIEDLGSRNGTEIRGRKIVKDQRVELVPGEVAVLGASLVMLQRRTPRLRRRRVWPHEYFEARLFEECEMSLEGNAAFSLVRIDLDRMAPAARFIEVAASTLRPSDIVGVYGPSAFEILMRRITPSGAERALEPLVQQLELRGGRARFAFAHFPGDGRSSDELMERACRLVRRPTGTKVGSEIIVRDDRMREVYSLAEKAARGNINILVLGETGVGKEVLAERIHAESKRADKPFLCLNCAAVTESLLESELFGHERGAFTDAKVAKPGLLEAAAGGTVFLDEIGEMSPTLQAKLLRVIETKQVTRVGGLRPVTLDVRFVAATHRDLVQEIRDKRFRSDLYYRLNGIGLEIPPLRERRSEILPLCEAFLDQFARQAELGVAPRLGHEAAALLETYDWPGNIRELRNVMERAMVLSEGIDIEPAHLPQETLRGSAELLRVEGRSIASAAHDDRWNEAEKAERGRILAALAAEGGNQTTAAKRLGIARGTLVARLEKFDIARPQKH